MAQLVKNLPALQETQETRVSSLGWEDPPEEGMATHSSILAWRIPWPEEPGGLQDTTEPLHTLTCVCKADSLYCTVETNNMVKQLHSNKD